MKEINYPVLYLGRIDPVVEDGKIMCRSTTSEDGVDTTHIRIIDDKNVPGDTLGKRRVSMLNDGVQLFKITAAIFFLGDLIKRADSKVWFIDSKGKLFKYSKTKRIKLQFRKLKLVRPIPSGGCIIEVEGIEHRFKSLFMPYLEDKYAGILKDRGIYILYGFFKEKYDQTWRMI